MRRRRPVVAPEELPAWTLPAGPMPPTDLLPSPRREPSAWPDAFPSFARLDLQRRAAEARRVWRAENAPLLTPTEVWQESRRRFPADERISA